MFPKVLIASGPTFEPIDPVRFISNRSSGKTGFHLASEAVARGCRRVVFVTGPTSYLPRGVRLVRVETALQMEAAVRRERKGCRVVIMAAAVSDYRPRRFHPGKIKKKSRGVLRLELVPNPDILKRLGQAKIPGQLLVGFALETDSPLANARRKLEEKNLDLIVLNRVSKANPAFGADDNRVTLVSRRRATALPRLPKSRVASRVWDEVERLAREDIP